jgi:hypothetical protein
LEQVDAADAKGCRRDLGKPSCNLFLQSVTSLGARCG